MDCQYFALCTNPAIGTLPNPIIGDVPTCRRCAEKMARLGGPDLTLFEEDPNGADEV